MQKVIPPPGKWQLILLLISLLVVVTDQLTKNWIESALAVGQSLPETGFFRLTHTTNTGAAFGIFYGNNLPLIIVALLGITLILLYVFIYNRHFPFLNIGWAWAALGLILGGTIGNLVDRLTQGFVTDFIDVGPWPNFNIADSSIVVGVIIFAITLLFVYKTAR